MMTMTKRMIGNLVEVDALICDLEEEHHSLRELATTQDASFEARSEPATSSAKGSETATQ